MNYRELPACLLCSGSDLIDFLDLGEQPLSGVFPHPEEADPPLAPLKLRRCADDHCGNVQLSAAADVKSMYGQSYGYVSGISPTMGSHLHGIADQMLERGDLKADDSVLDIGCNDGTLLNNFADRGLRLFGMDPSAERFRSQIEPEIHVLFDFFSAERFREEIGDVQFKAISSIAMFYDLEFPQKFADDVASLLDPDGVWVVELSDIELLLKNLTYDQICHEHLLYLGLDQMISIGKNAGLKLFEVSKNEINGGSFRLWFARNDCAMFNDIAAEVSFNATVSQLNQCARRVTDQKYQVKQFLELVNYAERTIAGYGASTKGNIVLHHCGITGADLTFISDQNPEKDGLVTPGTRIPIVSREEGRRRNPDIFIVLCWHFRREVISDEIDYLMKGGRLVFLLPRLHVVSKDNFKHYLDTEFEDMAFTLDPK